MIKHKLYDILLNLEPLPEEFNHSDNREAFRLFVDSKIAISYHAQRQLLQSSGQIPERIYFVEEGVVRGYFYGENKEKQHTNFIWGELSIVVDLPGLMNKKPSDLYIEVMPGSTLLSLSRKQLVEIRERFPYTEVFINNVIIQYADIQVQRNHDFMDLSAWERYLKLIKTFPKIEQKISKEIIASFIGVTPQSLSRLIKERGLR